MLGMAKKPLIWTPKRIRELRKALGLTQVEMAEKLHLSQASLSSMESGKSNPGRQTIAFLEILKESIR